jgi:hypothetical protein
MKDVQAREEAFWVIYAFLDPDPNPGTPLNPDPQHCQKLLESNQLVYRRALPEKISVYGRRWVWNY